VIQSGRVVGNIRLVEPLGQGGMAQVWLGHDEALDRRVAVKVLREKRRMDAASRDRFRREARLLSQLDHPGICRVLEFVEDDGDDFIVLEFLEGETLEQRLARRDLSDDARLAIAIQLADALTAAHAVSIIHRDLKPDNVMLLEDGTVKVLDFGLARSLRAEPLPLPDLDAEANEPDLTGVGDVMGTPRFMSPEQARGEAATAASDIYSFGLVLQVLFTGVDPYPEDTAHRELLTKAMWGDRQPAGPTHSRLRGLIDAMADPAPERRPTASSVLGTLQRHRDAPRRRRRRLALVGFVAGLVVLSVGLALALVESRRQERRAEREALTARQTADFLVDLFQVSDPHRGRSEELTAAEILARGSDGIRRELEEQPEVRSRLLVVLGGIYDNLGEYAEAETLYRDALETDTARFGPDDPRLARRYGSVAWALTQQGSFAEAEAVHEQAIRLARRLEGGDLELASILHSQMVLLVQQGRSEEADEAGREALAIRTSHLPAGHQDIGLTLAMLGLVELELGNYVDAEGRLAEAVSILEGVYEKGHPLIVQAVVNLATARKELGRHTEAEAMYRKAIEQMRVRLGEDHPRMAAAVNDLGVTLSEQERHAEAAETYQRAVGIAERSVGPEHPLTGVLTANLAEATFFTGDPERALQLYDEAERVIAASLGPGHPAMAGVVLGRADVLTSQGDSETAERLYRRAVEIRRAAMGEEHPEFGRALARLGGFLAERGREDEALEIIEQARAILAAELGADHPEVLDVGGLPGGAIPGRS
jgi:tetratricopeptide (TPR) repeat protein/tRNA A-37 threonylcarbamoyl transferase component Bud32